MKCYKSAQMHVGTCGDNFDNAVCTCDPIDAAEYPNTTKIFCAVTMPGSGTQRNIKTYFNDTLSGTYYTTGHNHTWMWVSWNSNGWHGNVRFDYCNGSNVVYTKSLEWTGPVDPCKDVICNPECFGHDLHNTKCEGGSCVKGAIIESNSSHCGYDPCAGVSCTPECFGHDLHNTECKDGVCVKSTLIDADNIETCKYDPCAGVSCDDDICDGFDLYDAICSGGACVKGSLKEVNSPGCGYVPPECQPLETKTEPCGKNIPITTHTCEDGKWKSTGESCPVDPCKGVVCISALECVGLDLYNVGCVDGACVPTSLYEANSSQCGYDPDEPTDEPTDNDLPDEPTEPRSPIDQLSELLKLKPSLVIVGIIVLLFFMMRR